MPRQYYCRGINKNGFIVHRLSPVYPAYAAAYYAVQPAKAAAAYHPYGFATHSFHKCFLQYAYLYFGLHVLRVSFINNQIHFAAFIIHLHPFCSQFANQLAVCLTNCIPCTVVYS